MTNSQIDQKNAIAARDAGLLDSNEEMFVAIIEDYDKKELRMLTSSQYKMLQRVAAKNK